MVFRIFNNAEMVVELSVVPAAFMCGIAEQLFDTTSSCMCQ